ncbi:MAG: S8 family serine peptidase [Planctomycetes bacterium]|nr:S8 family serine peptidase [Planctomycetota bacterium]
MLRNRWTWLVAVIVGGVAWMLIVTPSSSPRTAATPAAQGERLLVGLKTRDSTAEERVATLSRAVGVAIEVRVPAIGLVILRGTREAVGCAVAPLRACPGVRYVEQESSGRSCAAPNDPRYGDGQTALRPTYLEAAWDIQTGSNDVLVAVVDSGIDATHEDLAGAVVDGINFAPDAPGDTGDTHGHGTGVAGLIAARGNNGIGITGTAWRAGLLAVRVANDRGVARYGDLAQGIVWAADHGARIVNVSMAGRRYSNALHDAVRYASEHGALVVAATGSAGSHVPGYPAAFPEVLSVGGTTAADEPHPASDVNSATLVGAPADNVMTTYPGNLYRPIRGSSAAAAIVSGVAALVLARNPSLSAADLRRILCAAQVPMAVPGWRDLYRMGNIDAEAAVRRAAPNFVDVALRRALPAPREPVSGQPFAVKAEVWNAGNQATDVGEVRVWLDGADAGAAPIGPLQPGESRIVEVAVTVPATTGEHVLRVAATILGDQWPDNDEVSPPCVVVGGVQTDLSVQRVRVSPPGAPDDLAPGEVADAALVAPDASTPVPGPDDFRLRALVVNRGSASAPACTVEARLDGDAIGVVQMPPLGPDERRLVRFGWTPPVGDAQPRAFSLAVSSSEPDAYEGDNRGAAAFLSGDPADGTAEVAYPDLNESLEIYTDAPWRVDTARGYVPVLVFFPSVRWPWIYKHNHPGAEVQEFTISRRAGPDPAPPEQTPAQRRQGDAVAAATPSQNPVLFRDTLDGEGENLSNVERIKNENGESVWQAGMPFGWLRPLPEDAPLDLQITAGYHRIVNLSTGALGTGDGQAVDLLTEVVTTRPLSEDPYYRGRGESGPRVPLVHRYRKALRVRLGDALPSIADVPGAYIDAHNHTIAEWCTVPITIGDPFVPRRNFAGPIQMLKECAYAMGMVEDPPTPRKEYAGTLATTDHNVFFSPPASAGVPEETPPKGATHVTPEEAAAANKSLNGVEWDRYRQIFDEGGGEEIALQSEGVTSPHILGFRGPHVDGAWGGGGAASLDAILEKYAGRPDAFLFAAHPRGDVTDFPESALDRALGTGPNTVRTSTSDFVFKGLQVWNGRATTSAGRMSASGIDPWQGDGEGFLSAGNRSAASEKLDATLTKNLELFSKYAVRGLGHQDPANHHAFVRKLFMLGGSDAHGDFNYTADILATAAVSPPTPLAPLAVVQAVFEPFGQNRTTSDSAFGAVRTYAVTQEGKTPIESIARGQSVVTDGPLAWFALESNRKFDSANPFWHDLLDDPRDHDGQIGGAGNFDGKRTMLILKGSHPTTLGVRLVTSADFGALPTTLKLHRLGESAPWPGQETEIPVSSDGTATPTDLPVLTEPSIFIGEARSDSDPLNVHRCYTNGVWVLPVEETHRITGFSVNTIRRRGFNATWTFPVSMSTAPSTHVKVQGLDYVGNSTGVAVELQVVGWSSGPSGAPNSQLEVVNEDMDIPGLLEYPLDGNPFHDNYTWTMWIEGLKDANGNDLNAVATTFHEDYTWSWWGPPPPDGPPYIPDPPIVFDPAQPPPDPPPAVPPGPDPAPDPDPAPGDPAAPPGDGSGEEPPVAGEPPPAPGSEAPPSQESPRYWAEVRNLQAYTESGLDGVYTYDLWLVDTCGHTVFLRTYIWCSWWSDLSVQDFWSPPGYSVSGCLVGLGYLPPEPNPDPAEGSTPTPSPDPAPASSGP